jgi:hypothetical protein
MKYIAIVKVTFVQTVEADDAESARQTVIDLYREHPATIDDITEDEVTIEVEDAS